MGASSNGNGRATIREVYDLVSATKTELRGDMQTLKDDLRNEFHAALKNAADQGKIRIEVANIWEKRVGWFMMFITAILSVVALFRG